MPHKRGGEGYARAERFRGESPRPRWQDSRRTSAHAQFGNYQLPQNDFVWNWGANPDRQIGFEDFTVTGGEGGFHCELKGKINPGSEMTPTQLHQLEDALRSRIDFIYASSNYMNQLDQNRELDWAKLSCAKPEPTPATAQEKADRERRRARRCSARSSVAARTSRRRTPRNSLAADGSAFRRPRPRRRRRAARD